MMLLLNVCRPKADGPANLFIAGVAEEADLEVQGYSASGTAAGILFLQIVIQQRQLLPLLVTQLSCRIWHQVQRLPQALVVLVIVWIELHHVPAHPVQFSPIAERPWPAATIQMP